MTARSIKHLRSTEAIKVLPGTPDMPPNWSPDRQRRMLRAVKVTLRYLRIDEYNWGDACREMGKATSHQYVSQIFSKGLRYLIDHARIIDVKTGEPLAPQPRKRKAA